MKKLCRFCGSEFETIPHGGSRQFCFSCIPENLTMSERTIIKRQSAKKWGVINLGGKCLKCGEMRPYVLAFHHLDPTVKDEIPSTLIKNSRFEEFFAEIQKCILLCCNCHTEFHYLEANEGLTIEQYIGQEIIEKAQQQAKKDYISHKYITKASFLDDMVQSKLNNTLEKDILNYANIEQQIMPVCCKCGKIISSNTKNNLCARCYNLSKRQVNRPTKEELLEEIQQSNFCQVGKKYGVSDNAIRKWCRSYGLPSDKTIYTYQLNEE